MSRYTYMACLLKFMLGGETEYFYPYWLLVYLESLSISRICKCKPVNVVGLERKMNRRRCEKKWAVTYVETAVISEVTWRSIRQLIQVGPSVGIKSELSNSRSNNRVHLRSPFDHLVAIAASNLPIVVSWIMTLKHKACPEIKLKIHLVWTSVLPSENSRHHFVTFCWLITLP